MNRMKVTPGSLALLVGALSLPGCLNFQPPEDRTRYYILAPLATPDPASTSGPVVAGAGPGTPAGWAVGIGRIELPEYLQRKQIAVRRGDHEILYSEGVYWAERPDRAIQRVLGDDLALRLGSQHAVLSSWRRNEVKAEVYVSVQRFESDEQGRVVLEARWRITHPGGETTWESGVSRIARTGPAPAKDPAGAVATLGGALADLGGEIATAMRSSSILSLRP